MTDPVTVTALPRRLLVTAELPTPGVPVPYANVTPAQIDVLSSETVPVRFSTGNLLATGEAPTTPTSVLATAPAGVADPAGLSGAPTISGQIVTQIVTGLTPGESYTLAVTVRTNSQTLLTMVLGIHCPA